MTEQLFKTYVNGDQGDVLPRHEALRTVAVKGIAGGWFVLHKGDWIGADGYVMVSGQEEHLGAVNYSTLSEMIEKYISKGVSVDIARPCVFVDFTKNGFTNHKIMDIDLIMIKGSRVEIGLDREGHEAGEAHGVPYPAQSNVAPVIEDQDLIIAHGVTPEIYDSLADGTVTRWWDDMGSSVPAQELVLDVDEWDEDTGDAILKWELKEN